MKLVPFEKLECGRPILAQNILHVVVPNRVDRMRLEHSRALMRSDVTLI